MHDIFYRILWVIYLYFWKHMSQHKMASSVWYIKYTFSKAGPLMSAHLTTFDIIEFMSLSLICLWQYINAPAVLFHVSNSFVSPEWVYRFPRNYQTGRIPYGKTCFWHIMHQIIFYRKNVKITCQRFMKKPIIKRNILEIYE